MLNSTDFDKFKNFSDTENKLAEIWKNVLFLSAQKYNALSKSSDFSDFLVGCATIKLSRLTQQIEYIFKISTEPFDLDDYSILSEQAALIDSIIIHKDVILFLINWIKKVYSNPNDLNSKEVKIEQIPAEARTSLRDLLARSNWDSVLIKDIKLSCVENSSLIHASIPVKFVASEGAALITKRKLNLLFTLELAERSEPKILSLQHSSVI